MIFSPTFLHYKNLILHKAYADFRAEAERTYLGVLWWVLEPLINMCIYYLVFGVFLNRGTEDFIPFLLTGLVAWRWFNVAVLRAAKSVLGNVNLVRQLSFKKLIFPIIAVVTCSFEFVFSLLLLFTFLWYYGYGLSIHFAAFPLLLLIELLFILGFALPLSALVPFVPDLARLIEYGLRIAFYMSGVLYAVTSLPPKAQAVLRFNPAIPIIDGFRDVLMYGRWPQWTDLFVVTSLSIGGIVIGLMLLSRFDLLFAKRIAQ